MNLFILAASWVTLTYPTGDGSSVSYSDRMADPVPYLSRDTRMADAGMIGRPTMWQPSRAGGDIYQDVNQRYPVEDVIPRQQRFTVPIEEQMAMDQYRTQQLGQQTQIRGQMLNQKLAQKNFEYENNIVTQAEQAMPLYSRVDPRSPTFDAEIAEINERFPLAPQNQGIGQMISRLSSTRNQFAQDQEIKERNLQEHTLRAVERGDIRDASLQEDISKLGVAARKTYDEAIGAGEDPAMALALAATAGSQENALARQRQEMAIQGIRSSGPLDAREIIALTNAQQKLLEGDGLNITPRRPEDLSPPEKARYDYFQSLIDSSIQQQQNPGSSRPTGPLTQNAPTSSSSPATAQPQATSIPTAAPSSFFPKPSTPPPASGK